jgi:hypothetical protein
MRSASEASEDVVEEEPLDDTVAMGASCSWCSSTSFSGLEDGKREGLASRSFFSM